MYPASQPALLTQAEQRTNCSYTAAMLVGSGHRQSEPVTAPIHVDVPSDDPRHCVL